MSVPRILLATVLSAFLVCASSSAATLPQASPQDAISRVLKASPEGYARVTEPREFQFPDDHGAHPEYRSEWWYFTGNVATGEGRRFGFQLTFFRFALSPTRPDRASAWASHQIYMAHFALSDVEAGRFQAFERFSRGAMELAGARATPFRVWLRDWSAEGGQAALFPLRLSAAEAGYRLYLQLERGGPPVLQGETGLSQKSAEPGNASYYYSLTRIPTHGTLVTPAGEFRVEGSAWLDREWSTSALGAEQVGWDWFALQLSDGRDLMFYRLRRRDGSPDPFSSGVLVEPDGSTRRLTVDDVEVSTLAHWQSPRDGARYPSRWRLRVPSADILVEVTPQLADQELDLSFRYWEGATRLTGTSGGAAVTGYGYVELTGYATAP